MFIIAKYINNAITPKLYWKPTSCKYKYVVKTLNTKNGAIKIYLEYFFPVANNIVAMGTIIKSKYCILSIPVASAFEIIWAITYAGFAIIVLKTCPKPPFGSAYKFANLSSRTPSP